MSNSLSFKATVPDDPSLPGDPFQRLRYHYGMLLGAEDFAVEQREKVLRRRLHNALLHGVGTVWGLAVTLGEQDDTGHITRVMVEPGLAIDALGREIYVGDKLCLDVGGLTALADFWGSLKAPDGTTDGTVRRTYVVLHYQACQTNPVPAITAPCGEPGEAVAYSRVSDQYRVEIQAEPPGDPHRLQRDYFTSFLAAGATKGPRDLLLDFLLNAGKPDVPALFNFWAKATDAPLLLATLDLDIAGDTNAAFVVQAPPAVNPDNGVRALLPSVQLIAEGLFGERLSGAKLDSPPFQVIRWSVESATELHVILSRAPHDKTIDGAVSLHRLEEVSGWKDLTSDIAITPVANTLKIDLKNGQTLDGGTGGEVTYQIHLRGEGPEPLVSNRGAPLAGITGDALTRPARGRDVSIIDTWRAP